MAFKLAELFVDVSVDGIDKVSSGLDKIKSRSEKLVKDLAAIGTKLQTIGKGFLTFGIVAGGAFAFAVKKASDMEEATSKLEAVFKELAPEAKIFAKDFSENIGRSRLEIISFLGTLQDTFVPLGFAREKGAELSKQLVKLAIDLASFNNLADADVVRDLQTAIVGNVEVMRKYGVVINQANLNQELLNMGIKGGTTVATEAQKAQARLNLILKGTTDAQGDAERTSEGFANQLKATQAQIEELVVAVGQAFLPVAKDLLKIVLDLIAPLIKWAKQNTDTIVLVGKLAIGSLALGATLFILGQGFTALSAIMAGLPLIIGAINAAILLLAANPMVALVSIVLLVVVAFLAWIGLFGGLTDAQKKSQKEINKTTEAMKKQKKGIEDLRKETKKPIEITTKVNGDDKADGELDVLSLEEQLIATGAVKIDVEFNTENAKKQLKEEEFELGATFSGLEDLFRNAQKSVTRDLADEIKNKKTEANTKATEKNTTAVNILGRKLDAFGFSVSGGVSGMEPLG